MAIDADDGGRSLPRHADGPPRAMGQARQTARALLDRWPATAYMTAVESWRELPSGEISSSMSGKRAQIEVAAPLSKDDARLSELLAREKQDAEFTMFLAISCIAAPGSSDCSDTLA